MNIKKFIEDLLDGVVYALFTTLITGVIGYSHDIQMITSLAAFSGVLYARWIMREL